MEDLWVCLTWEMAKDRAGVCTGVWSEGDWPKLIGLPECPLPCHSTIQIISLANIKVGYSLWIMAPLMLPTFKKILESLRDVYCDMTTEVERGQKVIFWCTLMWVSLELAHAVRCVMCLMAVWTDSAMGRNAASEAAAGAQRRLSVVLNRWQWPCRMGSQPVTLHNISPSLPGTTT